MAPRRKLPEAEKAEIISCFSCCRVMISVGPHGGWCEYCHVSEYRGDEFSRTKLIRRDKWWGFIIEYIDHSQEHVPSPG